MSDETMNQRPSSGKGGSTSMITAAIVVIVLVVIGVLVWMLVGNAPTNEGQEDAAAIGGVTGDVIAVVGGEEIPREEFDHRYQLIEQQVAQQGQDISEEQRNEIVNSIIQQLVNEELVAQYAAENDLTVSQSEIDAEYQQYLAQFGGEEELENQLSNSGMSIEQLREGIEQQLLIEASLDAYSDASFEVSDEEVRAQYDEITQQAQGQDVPSFEDLEQQLRAQAEQQKRDEVLNQLIEELRADTEVEIRASV